MSELTALTELLGVDAALALIEAHGGTRLSVPRKADAASALRVALGEVGFLKLVQYFGGSVLTVPLARPWRAAIYRGRGMTIAAVARALGLTESAVYKMLADAGSGDRMRGRAIGGRRGAAGQMDMFPE